MSTRGALSRDHHIILAKIQLLERACLGHLRERTLMRSTPDEKTLGLVEDFLQTKLGLMLHFKVEEEALFPALRSVPNANETAISSLIEEHKIIMQRFSTLDHAKETGASIDLLLELLKDLSAHARKEEEQLFSSLIEPLTEDQLKSVDDAAKRLGYAV